MLLAAGVVTAVLLAARPAHAAVLGVTYTGPSAPTTADTLTWDFSTDTGLASCQVELDGAALADPADCTSPYAFPVGGGAAGTYTLVVYDAAAADVLAGAAAATGTSDVPVVAPPPPPPPAAPSPVAPAPSNDTSPTWQLGLPTGSTGSCTVTDAGGTALVGPEPCPGPDYTSDLGSGATSGDYTLAVTATDAGGTGPAGTATYHLDVDPPAAPTVSAPASPSNDTTPTFAVSGVEDGGSVGCSATGPNGAVAVSSCTATAVTLAITGTAPLDGRYDVRVVVTDAAGNPGPAGTASYQLDVTGPGALTVSAPGSPASDPTPTFTVTEADTDVTFACTLTRPDGSSIDVTGCAAGPLTLTLDGGDGSYRLTVTVTDGAGNATSAAASYALDTTAPITPQVSRTPATDNDRAPVFDVTGIDSDVSVDCGVTGPSTVTVTSCGASTALDLAGARDGDYVLTVTVRDAAGNTAAGTFTYTLDTQAPPAPTIGVLPARLATRQVTVAVSDDEAGVALTCLLTSPGGRTVFAGDCPADGGFDTSGFADGTYTLTVTATDAAGNTSTATTSWVRDTTAPPAPTVAGPGPITNRTQPTVTISDAETTADLTCVLTGPDGTEVYAGPCPTSLDTRSTGDGTYTLVVTATDDVGNSSTTTISWVRDTAAPPPPGVTPPSSPTRATQPGVTISDTEPGLAFRCLLTTPGGATVSYATCPATIDTRSYGDGTYTLAVTASDAAGNTAQTTVTWVRDTLPPPPPAVSAPAPLTKSRTVSLTIGDAEAGVALTCTLVGPDGRTVASGACPAGGTFDTTGFGDGAYSLTVTATDAAGNTASTTVGWARDTAPPPAPVVAPPTRSPDQDRSPSVTVSDAEAGVTYTCTVTGPVAAATTSCGPTTTVDLGRAPDGTYTITVTATDAAGNVSAAAATTYTLDTTAPAAPGVTATRSPAQGRHPTFTISGVEPGGVVTCSLSGPAGAGVGGTLPCPTATAPDLTGQPDGLYTITVTVTDAAGNRSAAGSASYLLDTTAPAAPQVAPPVSPGNDRTPTLAITAEPGALLTCTVERYFQPVSSGPCPAGGTLDLTGAQDGEFEITVTVTDAAGNTSDGTTVVYVLDTAAPAAALVTAPASPSPIQRPTWLWTAEDGVTGTCTVHNSLGMVVQGPTTCSDTFTAALGQLPDGAYTLTVVVTDAAGNSSAPAVSTFLLDRQAPVPPTVVPPASPDSGRHPQWEINGPRGAVLTCTLTRGHTVVFATDRCPADGIFSLTGDPDGVYTLSVTATDPAGNVSATSVTTYVLDTVAPRAPRLTYASPSPSAGTSPYWGFSLPAGTTGRCQLRRDGTVLESRRCTEAVSFDLSGRLPGTYDIVIVAVDAAGNVSAPLDLTYVLGHPSGTTPPPMPAGSSGGGPGGTPRGGDSGSGVTGHRPPPPPPPSVIEQTIAKLTHLSGAVRARGAKAAHAVGTAVDAVIPVIHDRFTRHVSQAVQHVVNAVGHAGGGAGFPLLLLVVVLAFLLVQNRIDRRDPKLALASVAADDLVEFLPPPSRGARR